MARSPKSYRSVRSCFWGRRCYRLKVGCASMITVVTLVSFLIILDMARLNSDSLEHLDFRLYQALDTYSDSNFSLITGSSRGTTARNQIGMMAGGLDGIQEVVRVFTSQKTATKDKSADPGVYQEQLDDETYCQWRSRVDKTKEQYSASPAGNNVKPLPSSKTEIKLAVGTHSNSNSQEICVFPKLDPCDTQILPFDFRLSKINCTLAQKNWVYVDNGTFRITSVARQKHGRILCEYAPIVRGKGDYTAVHAPHVKPMYDKSPLLSDFFKVACVSSSGQRYFNIHLGVAYNKELHERNRVTPLRTTSMGGYDVFVFGFDSVSRMSWMRNLPKTRDYFLRILGGIELEGHNIVGDGTVQSLLPLLTGNTESDLPSARRGDPDSKTVDEFPWIWKDFERSGYVTAWGEDMSHVGTFQLRLNGFKNQPTDHYMRTYFLSAEPMYHHFQHGCAGSDLRHIRFFNYFHDLYRMYGDKRKFMFGFHSEFSHEHNNGLKQLDEDFASFLENIYHSGYLNHTIFVLMADHGSRFSSIRSTQQGKLEERMPYFAFRFPPSFKAAYPKEVAHFRRNRLKLTTNFDIHETFHDILDFRPSSRKTRTKGRGLSLFGEIPETRTCEQAGVEPHWCACLKWEDTSSDSGLKLLTANSVVNFLNSLLSPVRKWCATLSVNDVLSMSRFVPTDDLLRFKGSADAHGDVPDLSDNMTLNFEYLQVTLITKPGQGRFEATVKHSLATGNFLIRSQDVSRTNKYGETPACISKSFPNLRPYCYCL